MSKFMICLRNDGNRASLIVGKVYIALADGDAESRGMVRVIDEDKSERDGYLYPASMFAPIELPEKVEKVLLEAAK